MITSINEFKKHITETYDNFNVTIIFTDDVEDNTIKELFLDQNIGDYTPGKKSLYIWDTTDPDMDSVYDILEDNFEEEQYAVTDDRSNINEHDSHPFIDGDMYEIIWLILNAYDTTDHKTAIENFFGKYNVNNGQSTDDVARDCIKSDMTVSDAEEFAISIGIDINVDLDESKINEGRGFTLKEIKFKAIDTLKNFGIKTPTAKEVEDMINTLKDYIKVHNMGVIMESTTETTNEEYVTVETALERALEETGLYSSINVESMSPNKYYALQLRKKGKTGTYFIEELDFEVVDNNTMEEVINIINSEVDAFYEFEDNTTQIKETMLGPGPDDRAIFYNGDIVLLYRTEEKATEERAKMRVQGAAVIDTPDKTHPYGVRIPVGHLVHYWYNNAVGRMSSFSNYLAIYNRKGEKIKL